MRGISVIMPSLLDNYEKSRSNAESKFIRAVESFLQQDIHQKELIIVSHGCGITNKIYDERYKDNYQVKLIVAFKEDHIKVGNLREAGRQFAKYNWITYLDSDDIILKSHLSVILKAIDDNKDCDFLLNSLYITPIPENLDKTYLEFFDNDLLKFKKYYEDTESIEGIGKVLIMHVNWQAGTWQITHKNDIQVRWPYHFKGEDKMFIELLKESYKWSEYKGRYIIMHQNWSDGTTWDN